MCLVKHDAERIFALSIKAYNALTVFSVER